MVTGQEAQPALLVATKKGLFIGRSDAGRREWQFTGPHCSGTWAFYAVAFDPATRTIYGGGASNWYGPAVWRSGDFGETWEHSSVGLSLDQGQLPVEQVWRILPAGEALYAGTDPAGLFRSDDGGRNWTELPGLRAHSTSARWHTTNGGTPLHAILPRDHDSLHSTGSTGNAWLFTAISAGGVYRTADGGHTWEPCTEAQDTCVHGLAGSFDGGGPLYQQNHAGVFRSDDAGASWTDISAGLPSRFGFPLAVHRRDARIVYAAPLAGAREGDRHMPESGVAIWRTRDGGESWQSLSNGLPVGRTYITVLRAALAVDGMEPAGVFFGTPTGQLFGSADEGDTWFEVARGLPPIYSLACAA